MHDIRGVGNVEMRFTDRLAETEWDMWGVLT
jgi:hypothetical protein